MTSEAARFREGLADVAELAEADLRMFWRSLDMSAAPEALLVAQLEYVPILTARYGDLAGQVAREWFDEMRAAAGVTGRYRASSAPVSTLPQVEGRVRSAASHLFGGDPAETLAALSSSLPKYVLQSGRDTIRQSIFNDPKGNGWRRVARAESCGFCRILEGRGGVYKERTVRFASHGACKCAAAPNWDPSAPEVDVDAYKASARTLAMSPAQRAAHNARVRDWIASNPGDE